MTEAQDQRKSDDRQKPPPIDPDGVGVDPFKDPERTVPWFEMSFDVRDVGESIGSCVDCYGSQVLTSVEDGQVVIREYHRIDCGIWR